VNAPPEAVLAGTTAPLGLPLALTGATRLYAIVGDPIEQAGSPGLFNQAFRRINLAAVLVPLQVPAAGVANLIELFRQSRNLDGLIVTVPHKVDIARHLDELGDSARRTGAVNTIRKNADGRLVGANFDGEGFMRGLQLHGHDVRGRKVMLIGAGGAGRAVAHALADGGAARITIADLDMPRAMLLAESVALEHPGLAVRAGMAAIQGHDMVVNCTPASGEHLPLELTGAAPGTLIADIALKPAVTPLMQAALARGLPVHAGIHMLVGQVDSVLEFFGLAAP
jgi:shikimate dehydrogenase